ncbi:pyridoxamine 5'-phosphate oxidase family protein [Micromonospora sp. C95]|uniref:pyridoxamine 5'-phosphate oxidase family protein n=1 Tax=Micromonospora sp. C95 TaxID=2824882 RepID=UPI001B391484|nr:pyridoxamine 5'-phosphate oxidase family protein [Micromonospora sp. C95]MBQ1027301.1 pyridoxamine 5'-phosphate oxidase family protein [Micromonospora sp. C95]
MSGGVVGGRPARARITELVRAARICIMTTISLDGRLVGRPMVLQRAEFDGQLWFFAYAGSATVRQVRVNPEVELSLYDPQEQVWASITGSARDDHDPARAARLWHPGLAAWFPDGPATANLTLVGVHPTAARCWDARGDQVELIGPVGAAREGASPVDRQQDGY